ncbi:DUF6056 family protein [Streptomyces sp. XM4011]|uniref:DUF6056 family protein n=1 Tax=Streptomyces sp. XM4011 TaxID=2929780 RepID=UPI001FFAA654|nr:DUF6056 family protein [Streptomyces sp. XM4011]MCK1815774.1 DUF6056 family protein [Streptomyces sp. XM4011]
MTPRTAATRRRPALAVAAAAGALLVVSAALGRYVRPTSDDWCAAWKTRELGIHGITWDFYTTQNGRVANAFLNGVTYTAGLLGPQLLPTLLLLALTGGLVVLGRTLTVRTGREAPLPALVAAALVLPALLVYASPLPYQTLLWAPATISHTLPAIIGLWLVNAALWAQRRGRRARRTAIACALAAGVFLGTLSEAFSAAAGVLAALAALAALPRRRTRDGRYVLAWCTAGCLGLAAGLALLYTSPGARARRRVHPPPGDPFSTTELTATVRDWLRVWEWIAGSAGSWVWLGAATAGLLLGLALRTAPLALPPLAVVAALRVGYGPSGWTYYRTWNSFLLPLLLALCLYGLLAGQALATRLRRPRTRTVAALLTTAATLAALAGLLPEVRALTSETRARAAAWDAQDARIRAETAAGATTVGYQPLHIAGLTEPFMAKNAAGDWAARCVAGFYHVDRIEPLTPHRGGGTP